MARILIVEDNRNLAHGLRTNLEFEGHQADVAEDGAAGLALARNGTHDLILLDLTLPALDGFRVLEALRRRGVGVLELTLHVGPGTFQPVKTETFEDHVVPPERAVIPPSVADGVNRARAEGRRVIAVGTTTTRALESAAGANGGVRPLDAAASLTITPGYRMRVVDGILTNFHLPRSSLLALVAAFAGRELVLKAYGHAVRAGYRFYSYGDATLIL